MHEAMVQSDEPVDAGLLNRHVHRLTYDLAGAHGSSTASCRQLGMPPRFRVKKMWDYLGY